MSAEKKSQHSPIDEPSNPQGLIQIAGKTLTKNQIKFNGLVSDIRKLSEELEKLKVELPKFYGEFLAMAIPLEDKRFLAQIQLIRAIDEYYREMKLTKNQKEVVQEYILFRVKDLPGEPNEEMKAIYNRYSDVPFEEEAETTRQMVNENLAERMEELFGVKIDFDFDPNLSEEENLARLQQQMEEKYGKDFSETVFERKANAEKPKSKKQIKREEAEAARQQTEDGLRKKSFKAIYTELMKAFHPDTEIDPERKAEKEEISKRITVAYGNQDFFALLKLEAEFLAQHEDRIQSLPQDQLSYYLKMLANQKAELKYQLAEITERYGVVYEGIYKSKKPAKEFYKGYKRDMEEFGKDIEMKRRMLLRKEPADRKMIVGGMSEELEEAMIDFMFNM